MERGREFHVSTTLLKKNCIVSLLDIVTNFFLDGDGVQRRKISIDGLEANIGVGTHQTPCNRPKFEFIWP